MKIFYSHYSLEPQGVFSGVYKASAGVLLKFVSNGLPDRFSLYHPIESLGDLSVNIFLNDEKKRAVLLEKIEKLTLSENSDLSGKVNSYFLCSSQQELLKSAEKISQSGFKVVKLKASKIKDVNFRELEMLPFKYIFDFNGRESVKAFEDLSSSAMDFLKNRVSYIEDPFQKKTKLQFNLASDFIDYGSAGDFKIVKPTGFNHLQPLSPNQGRLVATSYLDHPLGQLLSAVWAFNNNISLDCGLWTHVLFKKNKYSDFFEDTSFINLDVAEGFIKNLKQEEWRRV